MERMILSRVGRRGAIYLPKHVMRALNIDEGDRVLMKIDGKRLILEFIPDPLTLALRTKKWAKTTVKEFEEESEMMQNELYQNPA